MIAAPVSCAILSRALQNVEIASALFSSPCCTLYNGSKTMALYGPVFLHLLMTFEASFSNGTAKPLRFHALMFEQFSVNSQPFAKYMDRNLWKSEASSTSRLMYKTLPF